MCGLEAVKTLLGQLTSHHSARAQFPAPLHIPYPVHVQPRRPQMMTQVLGSDICENQFGLPASNFDQAQSPLLLTFGSEPEEAHTFYLSLSGFLCLSFF